MTDFATLPADLPAPVDDGACNHLAGMSVPGIGLPSTASRMLELAGLPGRTAVYCYPMTGAPGVALPDDWDLIPGARRAGVGPQRPDDGLSARDGRRLHLPFEVLSDAEFRFVDALRLPTFEVRGMRLVKRLTLILRDGTIEHVFYPVFPPDQSADQVIVWLDSHPLSASDPSQAR